MILSFIPLYLLSHHAMPVTLVGNIQIYFKAFLWENEVHGRGMHLLSWDKVCRSKGLGGLGIQDLYLTRTTYHGALVAKIILDPSSLWPKLFSHKYNFLGKWFDYKAPKKSSLMWHLIS